MKILTAAFIMVILSSTSFADAATGDKRVKFYNFDEMLIDGKIKKPVGLVTDIKGIAKFNRLIALDKSFLVDLMSTSRERTFK